MKNFVINNMKIWLSVGCLLVAMSLVIGNNKSTANDYHEYLEEQDMIDDLLPVTIPDDSEPIGDFDYAFDDDDGTVIDIMVLYSPIVEDISAGEDSNITKDINTAIQTANLVNLNSGVEFEFNLVHAQAISGLGTYSLIGDLEALRDSQEVEALRNEHHADLVSYWTAFGNGCGVAPPTLTFNQDNDSKKYGFSVVKYECVAAPMYSFIHELGHNFGLMHDPGSSVNEPDPPLSYGHGYALPGEFRTIMAKSTTCDRAFCGRIPYWSNPDVNYLGMPTGTLDSHDNARALNFAAQIVANYREARESCRVRYEYVEYSSGLTDTRVQIINTGETDFEGVSVFWEQKEVTEVEIPGLIGVSEAFRTTGDQVGFATTNYYGGNEREIVRPGETEWGVLRLIQNSPEPPNETSFAVNGIPCSAEAFQFGGD